MKFYDKLKQYFVREAAPQQLAGVSVVKYATNGGYIDRQITPSLIAADRKVPIVLSSLTGLSRVCFGGFDPVFIPIDEGDDTQGDKIDLAKSAWRKIDRRIGRVGKAKSVGTLGLVRRAALEGWTWRQSLFEVAWGYEDNWFNPIEIQNLPGQSFVRSPFSISGDERYVADKLLPGVVYDSMEDRTRFFQGMSAYQDPKELNADTVLYIDDLGTPDDTSLMGSLIPSIEAWREIRRDGMIAMKRVAVPDETAQISAQDLAVLKNAEISLDVSALIDHAEKIVQSQGFETAKVSLPGMRLLYPSISMPINPWEVDAQLQKEIVDYFFKRNVLEVTSQAISATNAPSKDLLDMHILSEREIVGKPFETRVWDKWLAENGFDLRFEFEWFNWAPKDQAAFHQRTLEDFRSHMITINEARTALGYPSLDDAEIQALADEHKLIWGDGAEKNVLNPSISRP